MKETKQSEVDELFQILLHTRRDAEVVNHAFKGGRRKSMKLKQSSAKSSTSHPQLRSRGGLLAAKKAPARHASRYLPETEMKAAPHLHEEGVTGRAEAETGAGNFAARVRSSVLCNQKIESSPFFSDQRTQAKAALRDTGFLTEADLKRTKSEGGQGQDF